MMKTHGIKTKKGGSFESPFLVNNDSGDYLLEIISMALSRTMSRSEV